MALTVMPASTRFISPNATRVFWLTALTTSATTQIPAVADFAAPTTTEVTRELAEWSGFSVTSSRVEVPDLVSNFTPTIRGRDKAEDSSLTFYASKDGADARTVFSMDQAGWVIFADNGITSGKKVDVFPATVSSVITQRGAVEGSAASRVQVAFALPSAPVQNVAIS